MSVTIFVWETNLLVGNIGHASIATSQPRGYMSWQPHGESTMTGDRKQAGYPPHYASPPIEGFDERRTHERWDEIRRGKYQLAGLAAPNCATAVIELLIAGGLYNAFRRAQAWMKASGHPVTGYPHHVRDLTEFVMGRAKSGILLKLPRR